MDEKREVEIVEIPGCAHFVFSLLIERGPFSGELFQPAVNHRNLEYSFYSSQRTDEKSGKELRPMFQSFYDPTDDEHFSIVSPISMYMVEVDEVTENLQSAENPGCEFRSLSELYLSHATPAGGVDRTLASGRLSGIKARALTVGSLQRMCNFFGYIIVDEKDKPVSGQSLRKMASLSEIYAFGRLFQNSDLGSPEIPRTLPFGKILPIRR